MRFTKALIDLSGTIHIENTAIPQAVEALERLRSTGVHIKFVTNTSKESRQILFNRLRKLGFNLQIDEIFSSVWAARDFIAKNKLNPMLLVADNSLEDFKGVCSDSQTKDSVVIGLAPEHFHYNSLNEAFRLLKSGAKLIAINKGRYHQTESGLSIGPGLFVHGLEYAADCKAVLIGKPSRDFFMAALDGTNPSEAVMIGDDARDDIGGAQEVGINGILVQTGKYKSEDENLISPSPKLVAKSFSEAVDFIIQSNNQDS